MNDTLKDAHRRVASLTAHDITPRPTRNPWWGLVIASLAFATGAAVIVIATGANTTAINGTFVNDPIGDAATVCDLDAGDGTITLNTAGNDTDGGDPIADLACVLTELGASDALIARIDKTTAMNGLQSDTIGRVRVFWSYHPDAGLFLAVERVAS